jgi:hypothetical protein
VIFSVTFQGAVSFMQKSVREEFGEKAVWGADASIDNTPHAGDVLGQPLGLVPSSCHLWDLMASEFQLQ